MTNKQRAKEKAQEHIEMQKHTCLQMQEYHINLLRKNIPKMPLNVFCVGHLLLGTVYS